MLNQIKSKVGKQRFNDPYSIFYEIWYYTII
jgi:hypothetical protein